MQSDETEVEKYLRIYKAFLTNKNALQEFAVQERLAQEAEDTKTRQGITSLAQLQVLKEVGRGASGVVFKVRAENGSEFAMKRIMISHLSKKQQREVLREVEMLKAVRHHNIIRYFGSFIENDYLFILMEYAEGGDLYTFLKRQKDKKRHFAENELWQIAFQVACALLHLHTHNIIHRDIKCLNVFLIASLQVKVGPAHHQPAGRSRLISLS